MLDPKELQKATMENLKKELEKSRKQIAQTSMQVRIGQSKANHEVKKLKKYIARILTIMNMTKKETALEKTVKKEENTAAAATK